MQPSVIVYDSDLNKVAYLENAFAVGYELPLNSLWRASFSMPADDEKNAECLPLRFVEIYDNGTRIDLFRITPTSARRSRDGQTIEYSCEHVLATLLDDVMFQYHTVGGLGVFTSDVIDYVLARQTVDRWQLGTESFARQFEYNWENENLLSALYSIPKPFVDEYQWTWNTSSYPWTLNLVEPASGVQAYIRYGYNMQGVVKTTDPQDLCTRLYCLGYGEGVNQLTIADVNGGLPYLDADTQGTYGVISRIFIDRRFDNADSLKARGEAILGELKTPRISYQVDASDLSSITDDPVDRFTTGTQVRVIDEELGVDIIARVVNVRKSDVTGAPGDVQLEIANKPIDIAGSIAELAERQRIEAAYAQGATNINVYDLVDNCDPDSPAILKFWIPDEAVRINKVMLSYENVPFRGYSKAIEGGGAITTSTEAGGFTSDTTSTLPASIETSRKAGTWFSDPGYTSGADITDNPGDHNHGIPSGTQLLVAGGGSVAWTPSGSHTHVQINWNHSHQVDLPAHNHGFEVPDHTHGIELPNHTHGIEFGIFEGPTADEVAVSVDGNVINGLGVNESNVDLIPYLSVDGEGKVLRGQWHEIEIAPNDLSRIRASVIVQFFVQSRGGGNY